MTVQELIDRLSKPDIYRDAQVLCRDGDEDTSDVGIELWTTRDDYGREVPAKAICIGPA